MDPSKVSKSQFIDLKSRSSLAPDNFVVTLSQRPKVSAVSPHASHKPTFGFISSNNRKNRAECLPKSKAFIEELPLEPIDVDDNVVISLRNSYSEGEVKCTTKDALRNMMQKLSRITVKDTGCIINETCDPECSQYTQNIHFVSSEALGQGSFGVVDLCYDSKTEKPFIRKRMQKSDLRASEVIAPTTFDHPNITEMYGLVLRECSFNCKQPMMELYLEHGGDSLTKLYRDGKRFEHTQIRSLTKQGLDALKHMDLYNIIHLDIKPDNICILEKDGSQQLKITDFGSSRLPNDRLEFVGVTPEYMAPEMCQLYLQRHFRAFGFDWGLTENDITGKVDMFAFALVVMFMYKGYHILVRIFNNGNGTYKNLDTNKISSLQFNMMVQMAKDSDEDFFIQKLIPDECSVDMRDLLIEMTQHKHKSRVSARRAFEQIEAIEKRSKVIAERKSTQDMQKQKVIPQNMPLIPEQVCVGIPVVVGDSIERPVSNHTISLLRQKLQPYKKDGHKGKVPKHLAPKSPQMEMQNLRRDIAGKKLQMPTSSFSAFGGLSLEQTLKEEQTAQRISGTTERNAPLAQPSMDIPQEPFFDIWGQKGVVHDVFQKGNNFMHSRGFGSTLVEESHHNVSNNTNNVSLQGRNPLVQTPGTGQQNISITPENLMKLLKAQQMNIRKETEVQPPVINLDEYVGNRTQKSQPKVPMEESGTASGNLPNLADFLMD